MSDVNPLNRLNEPEEQLLQEYRQRFGDDPPVFLFQGQGLIEAVREALDANRPILFDVPDDGYT